MYRICRVLNHNGVIAFDMQDNKEYVLLGKGVGFGKKVGERMERPEECTVYSLQVTSSRGSASELARSIDPEYLEMTNQILNLAEEQFGTIDRSILFPMADHIAFAVKRMQKGEQISNPLTPDIKTLFNGEFKVALKLKEYLEKIKESSFQMMKLDMLHCIFIQRLKKNLLRFLCRWQQQSENVYL